MKKILLLNGINYGSTGKIMNNIADKARKEGYDVYTACRKSRVGKRFEYKNQFLIGPWLERVISEKLAYYTGLNGHFNVFNTLSLINHIKRIKPDIIHIHNLCDNYLNNKLLFKYLSKVNIPIVWTFHDCWPITARCGITPCANWKKGCGNCPNLTTYPKVFIDRTKRLYSEKKEYLNSIKEMYIVTPSNWLKSLVEQSYLSKKYPIMVINNGIDLSIFKPVKSDFKRKYNIQDKHMVLAVSYNWYKEKGIDTLIRLGNELPDDFKLVVVGGDEETDKLLSRNVISIHKTFDQQELTEIYSAADLFINPSIDENYPTVNMEAIACGCPVLAFDVGGCIEMIDDKSGKSVKLHDYENFKNSIIEICRNNVFNKDDCINKAKSFDMNDRFQEYVDLYKRILKKDI